MLFNDGGVLEKRERERDHESRDYFRINNNGNIFIEKNICGQCKELLISDIKTKISEVLDIINSTTIFWGFVVTILTS
jgi:hypothetical protein